MLQSMTGFGKASGISKNKKITVEIKSLNSKNLDLFVKMPSEYKQNEIELRKIISSAADRGKVECSIQVEMVGKSTSNKINTEVLDAYYHQLSQIAEKLDLKNENLLPTLMRMPDIFTTEQVDIDPDEWDFIVKLVHEAVEGLIEFRNQEGALLYDEFKIRIDNIKAAFAQLPQYENDRIESIKERIKNNLLEQVGVKIDQNRFEQELIFYIEKFDVSEERHRLENHLNYFMETLDATSSKGKKLGFITQEIGREINTLGSKSYHVEMQKLVVEMKDELEKIKEQVLNSL
ncbi:YicC/YloC family endoribonuclease [Crocinitomix catalasitica]|uniref:YicC/YloC family endoribonuclease n=1 Tax=Crocinitomix catalasitica TaxID=184607 RepID=UPI0004860AAC|nr:YicC/YloC family endoribonuclease [Crocinitomix catalasitica]